MSVIIVALVVAAGALVGIVALSGIVRGALKAKALAFVALREQRAITESLARASALQMAARQKGAQVKAALDATDDAALITRAQDLFNNAQNDDPHEGLPQKSDTEK